MTDKTKQQEEESGENIGNSLFTTDTSSSNTSADDMTSFAEQFIDKTRAIHEHFDKNKDGFLNFDELSSLQLCTSGEILDGNMYQALCQGLGCQPNKGLSLDGLKLTYASEGTNLDEDYEKIFGDKVKGSTKERKAKGDDDGVYEVGEDGVDISL
eukprot:CAMPEP_0203688894 /NCGR_PEP_ID=MMETSP0091-20130426/1412_1 /ASSEMBLY_ACC=CAM_ASM_001089 /TAXON_ID=426623 /ORGANISM="Chaetoceros affinis, Strain CCMP159" /LENGTH=154 /DNA_ID=CAMNT_0050558453 /DNA_START=172 /DNA_END=636 /DNA_ORIENTATION=+